MPNRFEHSLVHLLPDVLPVPPDPKRAVSKLHSRREKDTSTPRHLTRGVRMPLSVLFSQPPPHIHLRECRGLCKLEPATKRICCVYMGHLLSTGRKDRGSGQKQQILERLSEREKSVPAVMESMMVCIRFETFLCSATPHKDVARQLVERPCSRRIGLVVPACFCALLYTFHLVIDAPSHCQPVVICSFLYVSHQILMLPTSSLVPLVPAVCRALFQTFGIDMCISAACLSVHHRQSVHR